MTAGNKRKLVIFLRILSVLAFGFFLFMTGRFIGQSFWRDEAVAALTAQKSPGEIIQIMIKDNNPPLFRLILSGIYRFFGGSEIALRAISVLSVISSAVILRNLIKNKVGKELATISFFMMPGMFIYGTEARAYMFFMFLCLLSYYLMIKLHKKKSLLNYSLFVLAATAMLYTLTSSLFVFAGIIGAFLYLENKRSFSIKKLWQTLRKLPKTLIPVLTPILLFSPWIVVLLRQAQSLKTNNYWLTFHPLTTPAIALANLFTQAVFYYPPNTSDLLELAFISAAAAGIAMVLVLTVILGGRIKSLAKQNRAELIIFLALPFLLSYITSFYQPNLRIRYLAFMVPVALAVIVQRLPRGPQDFGFAATILCSALGVLVSIFLYASPSYKPDYKALTSEISTYKSSVPELLVAAENELPYFPCEWYLGNCHVLEEYPEFDEFIGKALLSPERAVSNEDVSGFEDIAIIYWPQDAEQELGFLEDYEIIKTYTDEPSGVSVVFYHYTAPSHTTYSAQ